MTISFEQLAAFVGTVDNGSFSAAARAMRKAQSAVSTAVINLEIYLGVTLFDRTGKYPILTPEGESILRDARMILVKGRELEEKAQGMCMGVESSLTLALDEVLPKDEIISLLKRFTKDFPYVNLEILSASLGDAQKMVKSGRAHIGVIAPIFPPPFEKNIRFVGNLRFLPAVGTIHPLASFSSVTLTDVASYRQLLPTSRSGEKETADFVFSNSVWWAESVYTVRDMIREGVGWGFLPEYLIEHEEKLGSMKRLPLTAVNTTAYVPIMLTWTLASPCGPASKFLISELEQIGFLND